jgi:hypothetical protein
MRVICPSLASAPPHQNIITLFNQQSDGRLVTWKASQNPEGKIVTHPLHTKIQPLGATRGHLSRQVGLPNQPPGLSQISSRCMWHNIVNLEAWDREPPCLSLAAALLRACLLWILCVGYSDGHATCRRHRHIAWCCCRLLHASSFLRVTCFFYYERFNLDTPVCLIATRCCARSRSGWSSDSEATTSTLHTLTHFLSHDPPSHSHRPFWYNYSYSSLFVAFVHWCFPCEFLSPFLKLGKCPCVATGNK